MGLLKLRLPPKRPLKVIHLATLHSLKVMPSKGLAIPCPKDPIAVTKDLGDSRNQETGCEFEISEH